MVVEDIHHEGHEEHEVEEQNFRTFVFFVRFVVQKNEGIGPGLTTWKPEEP
jgi:hypothetical protein